MLICEFCVCTLVGLDSFQKAFSVKCEVKMASQNHEGLSATRWSNNIVIVGSTVYVVVIVL